MESMTVSMSRLRSALQPHGHVAAIRFGQKKSELRAVRRLNATTSGVDFRID